MGGLFLVGASWLDPATLVEATLVSMDGGSATVALCTRFLPHISCYTDAAALEGRPSPPPPPSSVIAPKLPSPLTPRPSPRPPSPKTAPPPQGKPPGGPPWRRSPPPKQLSPRPPSPNPSPRMKLSPPKPLPPKPSAPVNFNGRRRMMRNAAA